MSINDHLIVPHCITFRNREAYTRKPIGAVKRWGHWYLTVDGQIFARVSGQTQWSNDGNVTRFALRSDCKFVIPSPDEQLARHLLSDLP